MYRSYIVISRSLSVIINKSLIVYCHLTYIMSDLNKSLSMPTGFSSGGTCTLLPSFLGVHPNFWGAMYPLSLHFGVQRKLTAFSPRKVVHHAVFCKYYGELAKTFFLSDFEVNCKQKVIFIQCSQWVLYVHARRALSIILAWFLFYVKHVLHFVTDHILSFIVHYQWS